LLSNTREDYVACGRSIRLRIRLTLGLGAGAYVPEQDAGEDKTTTAALAPTAVF
jgi:hypothetical protein